MRLYLCIVLFIVPLIISTSTNAYYQYIQAAFALGSAILSAVNSSKTEEWQQGTSKKLDKLIGMSQNIVDDLKRLRVDIQKITTDAFKTYVDNQLRADIRSFNFNMKSLQNYSKSDATSKIRIAGITNSLEKDSSTLSDYGPATYHTVFASVLATKALYNFTRIDKEHQRSFLKLFEGIYDRWLQPNPGNPTFIRQAEEALRDHDLTALKHYVGSGTRSVYDRKYYTIRPRRGPDGMEGGGQSWCDYTVVVNISGNVEAGFKTAANVNVEHPEKCPNLPVEENRKGIQGQLDTLRNDYLLRKQNISELMNVEAQLKDYRDAISGMIKKL